MTEVSVIKGGNYNMYSITRMMKTGWKMTGDAESIQLSKDGVIIKFDIVIPTAKGCIFCMYFSCDAHDGEIQGGSTEMGNAMIIEKAHRLLNHMSEDETRKAAKLRGWKLTPGPLVACVPCTKAKAKQKNVCKESDTEKATESNGRIYLDISTIRAPKKSNFKVAKGNWLIMVDERSGMKISRFFATKDEMVEPVCEQFQLWKGAGIPVKILRMDNAGENKKLQQRLESSDWKLNVAVEYTARATPQHNAPSRAGVSKHCQQGKDDDVSCQFANGRKVQAVRRGVQNGHSY